jgi:uncharacterized protein (TIGR02001 family)
MHRWFMPLLCGLVALPAWSATPQVGGSITASSNYLLRGTSRNYNDPALSTEIHAAFSQGMFASLWASSTRLRAVEPTTAELAATLGYTGRISAGWSWVGSLSHYETPWSHSDFKYRYNELTLDLHWQERLLLSASWSPDTSRYAPAYGYARKRATLALEALYQQALPREVRAYAGVGYYDLSDLFGSGYWYGSIGLGWSWHRWQLDAAWVVPQDTARRLSYPGAARQRLVGSLSFNF